MTRHPATEGNDLQPSTVNVQNPDSDKNNVATQEQVEGTFSLSDLTRTSDTFTVPADNENFTISLNSGDEFEGTALSAGISTLVNVPAEFFVDIYVSETFDTADSVTISGSNNSDEEFELRWHILSVVK